MKKAAAALCAVLLFAALAGCGSPQPGPGPQASTPAQPVVGAQHATALPARPPQPTTPTYTNSSGQQVHRPEFAQAAPAGATAQCRDGSYSFSLHRRGTCSHHRGVATWLQWGGVCREQESAGT